MAKKHLSKHKTGKVSNTKLKFTKEKKYPTLDLKTERDIAMDFSLKAYKKFDKIIKAIVLFGSSVKGNATSTSDVDIIIVVDDASISWDQELIAWYREELAKIASSHPYTKELHITTVKLTTWWEDLLKGDPVVINVLRYGEAVIDIGGFFNPLKALLIQGKIKSTPEAIHNALQRAPEHFNRSKFAELGAIEGLFWAMVDSSQAALMAYKITPPSTEHIPSLLKEMFVDTKMLKIDYVNWYRDLYVFHRKIVHGEIREIKGNDIDIWQKRTDDFIRVMAEIVKSSIEVK
ncbi:MAG TPA: nucleotidyltransferase domain-containing protein [Candidatus Nanoarchaeia archaeon]|nr:nucleotidyltransferase domain-containing protein [Candidatus Nanoarchaeia archaeon]